MRLLPGLLLLAVCGRAQIAYDNSGACGGSSSPATCSYTVGSGTNRYLFVTTSANTDTVTSVTYNGVAMALAGKTSNNGVYSTVFTLANPASGSNILSVDNRFNVSTYVTMASYSGAAQTGNPVQAVTGTASGTAFPMNLTTTHGNSWLIAGATNQYNVASWSGCSSSPSGATLRQNGNIAVICDNGPIATPGATSLTLAFPYGGCPFAGVIIELAAATGGSPPATPDTLSPGGTTSPGPTTGTLTPSLSWSASTGASSYNVTVMQGATIVYSGTVSTTSVTTPPLSNNAAYYWYVSATNSYGTSAVSANEYFQTSSMPAVPTGLSPGTAASPGASVGSVTPTLSWTAAAGATSYNVTLMQAGTTVYSGTVADTSVTAPPLTNGLIYYWYVSAANSYGSSAASTAEYFLVYPPCTGYAYSATLTVAQVTAPLNSFPVMVSQVLPAQNILSPQGFDVCVSDMGNTTSYPIQWFTDVPGGGHAGDGPIHVYNWATGKADFVFEAPALSSSGTTTFKIWTGNPFAGNPDSPLVWDADATLVAHMQENGGPGQLVNAVNGSTNTTGPTSFTRTTGLIGFAQSFSALNFNPTYGPCGSNACSGASSTACMPNCGGETISVLIKTTSSAAADLTNTGRYNGNGPAPDIGMNASGQVYCQAANAVTGPVINDGTWHHLMCNGSAFYVDGVLQSGSPGGYTGYSPVISASGNAQTVMEDLRVAWTTRSSAWAAAEASNLLSPSTFVTIGAGQFASAAGPTISVASLTANSPSSLKATWTTSTAATSQVLCGTAPGGPYSYFTPLLHAVQQGAPFWGVTSHSLAITGLPNNASGTAYYCVARSIDPSGNWTISSEMHSGTLGPLTSTPMTVSWVSPITRPNDQVNAQNGMAAGPCWFDGDTQYSTWAADGNQYGICEDCGGPQAGSSAGTVIYKWNDLNHHCSTAIASGSTTSSSGAGSGYSGGSGSLSPIGITSVNGTMYWGLALFGGSMNFCCSTYIKSSDYWAHSISPQHNTGPSATPIAGIDWPGSASTMWNRSAFIFQWLQYGQDYNSSGSLPWYAGTDGWVYVWLTDSGRAALARVRVEDLPLQDATKWQFYYGARSGDDGMYDPQWAYDYTQELDFQNTSPLLAGSWSKWSMTFIPDFNRFALVTNPQIPGGYTAGTTISDCPYPWSMCTAIGNVPRSPTYINSFPGFGQLLPATYAKTSGSPLSSRIALSTASGYRVSSGPMWDFYTTYINQVGLAARSNVSRPVASSNSRSAHIPNGLDLDYEFKGNSGDTLLRNVSPNDPVGNYNVSVSVPQAFVFDQYGMYNFGITGSGPATCCWGSNQNYTLTTPYTNATPGPFTVLLVWAHYPALYPGTSGPVAVSIPSNETVLAKGPDLRIERNGTAADSWNVSVAGTTVATGLSCTDGTFCAVVVRRDAAGSVTVYRSNSIQQSLPLTPDAAATVGGAWSSSPITLGSTLIGVIAEHLVWSRALTDTELIHELGVVRQVMAARGVTLQ